MPEATVTIRIQSGTLDETRQKTYTADEVAALTTRLRRYYDDDDSVPMYRLFFRYAGNHLNNAITQQIKRQATAEGPTPWPEE